MSIPQQVRITTLTENTASFDYLAEWGLSMIIETGESTLLFDTGRTFTALYNAQLHGIDLSRVDKIVLSHGHSDHTGGLRDILRRSGPKEVIAHPSVWEKKYARREGREKYAGIPFTREELEADGASFVLSREPVAITDYLVTTGEVPLVTDFEDVDPNLFVREAGRERKDTVPDDLSLIIKAAFGVVVVLGCAHRGLVNTLYHVRELVGEAPIYAVIGGTHLFGASPERIERTARALREFGVERLGVSHCTGFPASSYLSREFGDAFFMNNAGMSFTLPPE